MNDSRKTRIRGKLRRYDDCGSQGGLQLLPILWTGKEGDLPRPGGGQATNLRHKD